MNTRTQAELEITMQLLDTRRQLIEANMEIMRYQRRDTMAEYDAAERILDNMKDEADRNKPLQTP